MILTKEISSKRLKNLKYLVYNIRGYTLPNYQYLFKGKRPKGFKAVGIRIKRVLIKVEYNKDLAYRPYKYNTTYKQNLFYSIHKIGK